MESCATTHIGHYELIYGVHAWVCVQNIILAPFIWEKASIHNDYKPLCRSNLIYVPGLPHIPKQIPN